MSQTMFNKFLLVLVIMLSSVAMASEKENDVLMQVLFKNVNIFDGKNEKLKTNMSVLVEGNLIKEISKNPKAANGAKVIDGGGRTLPRRPAWRH